MFRKLLTFTLLIVLMPRSGFCADIAGSKDHPLLARYPNSRIAEYKNNFDEVEFHIDFQGVETKSPIEGQVTTIRYFYGNANEQPSPLQLIRNYQNAVNEIGGEIIYERKPAENDGGETTLKLVDKGREYWIKVIPDIFSAPTQSYQLTILEKEAMTQLVKANKLMEEMNNHGFITLYINFDTNESKIKPDAKPALAEVAKMLGSTPELKVRIEGHTDNVGDPESNKKLSMDRASSVMRYLTYEGVGADRMIAVGLGQEKPIADNKNDAGRALNRRVEIVKR
jgi:outer membrane protein OmpA-like peptidoglycan-associated protein